MKRLHAIVYGRVQGVGYRAFIYDKALYLGLKGFVKNLPDGSVEIEAEGEEKDLFKLIEFAKSGPPLSNVTNIEYDFYEDLKNYDTFKISY